MIELEIDGNKVEVPEGSMVIQAAKKVGCYVPHFCYHKKLSIAANCRMCLVEVEKMPKAMPACATPVAAGMVVHTQSTKAVNAQRSVMEFLLINHPLDCPICDQAGECQLQDLAVGYGASNSRYTEEKRVVFQKQAGPLISMQEMTRCIHCTRCVRFGQEIAGVMELGMVGRGEHAEIATFVSQSVDSELSGNMIDLCPVGALTSKPFRYRARNWELGRYNSISPHDSLGSNLLIQTAQQKVMRVLPKENEALNACWLSDKDRFSYEALNSEERLTQPLLKKAPAARALEDAEDASHWQTFDWPTALQYTVQALKTTIEQKGPKALAIAASPHSTLEELYLLKRIADHIGTPHIDFCLRQSAQLTDLPGVPWLGMPIAEVDNVRAALVIGSLLHHDHPLLAARLRQAAKSGAQVYFLNAVDEDARITTAHRIVAAPSAWLKELGSLACAVAELKKVAVPAAFSQLASSPASHALAQALLVTAGDSDASDESIHTARHVIWLGNAAVSHPDFHLIHAAAQWIAQQCGATLGFLPEAANTVGAHALRVMLNTQADKAQQTGTDSAHTPLFQTPHPAWLLFNVEPQYDVAHPAQALATLNEAEVVVSLSAFSSSIESDNDYADALLPITPFTETGGSFVNAQGILQRFNGVVRPLGEARPGWKVLRALANLLDLPGFTYDSVEEVHAAALKAMGCENSDFSALLSNAAHAASVQSLENKPLSSAFSFLSSSNITEAPKVSKGAVGEGSTFWAATPASAPSLERFADVPIYHADPLVRRAPSLHRTQAAKQAHNARLPAALFKKLDLISGDKIRVYQGEYSTTVSAVCDATLPDTVIRLSSATPASACLGDFFGEIRVEKVEQ